MDRIDVCLEITAIMLLLFGVFTTLIIWNQLPERVPMRIIANKLLNQILRMTRFLSHYSFTNNSDLIKLPSIVI